MYTVYRHYDWTGKLLYVGRSKNVSARDKIHKDKSYWWFNVVYTETEKFESFEEARCREADLICGQHPLYNKMKPWHHTTLKSCPKHGPNYIMPSGGCRICRSEYERSVRLKKNKGRTRGGRRDQKIKSNVTDLYDPLENGMSARVSMSQVKP